MSAVGRDSPDTLAGQVLEAAVRVRGDLGFGCPQAAYANGLALELRRCGLEVGRTLMVHVQHAGVVKGRSHTLLVERELIVDVEALPALGSRHRQRCEDYLRATELPACLLLNFGYPRLSVERFTQRA